MKNPLFWENLLEKKEKLSNPNPNPMYNTLYLDYSIISFVNDTELVLVLHKVEKGGCSFFDLAEKTRLSHSVSSNCRVTSSSQLSLKWKTHTTLFMVFVRLLSVTKVHTFLTCHCKTHSDVSPLSDKEKIIDLNFRNTSKHWFVELFRISVYLAKLKKILFWTNFCKSRRFWH